MNPEKSGYNSETQKNQISPYEVKEIDSPIVEHYQPQYLAQGGEHIVYQIPDHPNVVVKVLADSVKRVIEVNADKGVPADTITDELRDSGGEYIKKESERFNRLKEIFGKEHVLNQKKSIVKLPINEKILAKLFNDNPPAHPEEVYGIVVVQEAAQEFRDENRLTVVSGYAESSDINPELYNSVNAKLLSGEDVSKEELLGLQSNNHLAKLLNKSESEDSLKDVIRDFVTHAIEYTDKTGETLDLAGSDNVIFFEHDGIWNYKLVDALYPQRSNMIERTRQAIEQVQMMGITEPENVNILMNSLNYIRTINGLASLFGIEERINVLSENDDIESLDFLSLIKLEFKK
jgi:hypothetical protein